MHIVEKLRGGGTKIPKHLLFALALHFSLARAITLQNPVRLDSGQGKRGKLRLVIVSFSQREVSQSSNCDFYF